MATQTPYEKILNEINGLKNILVSVADNMYKTQESHAKSLEVFAEMTQCFKSLNDKLDDALEVKKAKNTNEGFVLAEEQCFDDNMLHLIVGFKHPVKARDIEQVKKDCTEKYGLQVAFICQIDERLLEVYMQETNNINI